MPSRIDLDRAVARTFQTLPYKAREFFYHADDRRLKELTGGSFPYVVKSTHPIFVLGSDRMSLIVCPCSSEDKINIRRYRYIPRATVNVRPEAVPEKTTYIIEDKSFPLPNDEYFMSGLTSKGQVPEDAIEGKFTPEEITNAPLQNIIRRSLNS